LKRSPASPIFYVLVSATANAGALQPEDLHFPKNFRSILFSIETHVCGRACPVPLWASPCLLLEGIYRCVPSIHGKVVTLRVWDTKALSLSSCVSSPSFPIQSSKRGPFRCPLDGSSCGFYARPDSTPGSAFLPIVDFSGVLSPFPAVVATRRCAQVVLRVPFGLWSASFYGQRLAIDFNSSTVVPFLTVRFTFPTRHAPFFLCYLRTPDCSHLF